MSKGHLKKIVSPKTWRLNRKQDKFVIKPLPGAHSMKFSIPLGFLFREKKIGFTAREIKKIINSKTVLVDNRRIKDPKYAVGLLDIIHIKETKDYFRIVLDSKGRLKIIEINEAEAKFKPCRVNNKTVIKGNRIQLNLFDSRNILSDDKNIRVGDSVLIDTESNTISDVFKFEKGACILLTGGSHMGSLGIIKDITGNNIVVESDNLLFNTKKDLAFVVGKNKEAVKLK